MGEKLKILKEEPPKVTRMTRKLTLFLGNLFSELA